MSNDIIVDRSEAGQRLDIFLSDKSGHTRSRIRQAIERGEVKINGKIPSKAGYAICGGDIIEYAPPPPADIDARPQDIPIQVLYEDNYLAVIIKPQGMVVHPAAGHAESTLVNAMLFSLTNLSGIGGALRPGIVHRLDKDTSGIMVIAKNDEAHLSLSSQFKEKTVQKEYLALVLGAPKADTGTVDAPIGRHTSDRKRMAVVYSKSARHALTNWEVLERFRGAAYLRLEILTGRTHQIRVHMAHIGHPVLDDPVYGRGAKRGMQYLHARSLSFFHPATGERMTFSAPPPERFTNELERLRRMT